MMQAAPAPIQAAAPAPSAETGVLRYPPAFFAAAQPVTALDMVARVPGFTFDPGDSDVRGFAGAAGNVLIDGRRPASKQDALDEVLRRIPAASVERVELIRGGAPGIDMAGRAVLLNIVRRREVASRMQIEAGSGLYPDGRATPNARMDASRRAGDTLWEGAAAFTRAVDDDKGRGPRLRFAPDGRLLRDTIYDEDDRVTTGEISLGHERRLGPGRLRLNAAAKREHERAATSQISTIPLPVDERDLELQTDDSGEIGAVWDGPIAPRTTLELTGLQRVTRTHASQSADTGSALEQEFEASHGGETIARGLLRWQASSRLTIEGGGEAALNILDSSTRLLENRVAVPLPAASVRVEERRGEGFATATWRPSTKVTVEAGGRVEVSRLVQSGDSSLTKRFVYPKPRLLASWSPNPRTQFRLGIQRTVGQLNFGDFVSSASLTSNTVTAGNADLEPDKQTTYSAAIERRFAGQTAIVLTASHIAISDVVDRVPVRAGSSVFDAPGNIGDGTIDRIEGNVTVPLDWAGLAGGLLKASGGTERSRVSDPTTGERRRISSRPPFDLELHLTQDRPKIGFRWGADVMWREVKWQYRFNEVRCETVHTQIDLFAELKIASSWTLRAFADNITARNVRRIRAISSGPRGVAPLSYVEDRNLNIRPTVGFLIRHTIGRKLT